MIANSEQAVAALRHKRTGEPLPTKNIERNTKLIYYCDELVALRFHQTDIALYTPNGVRLDVRENEAESSPLGEGWFTVTTWARIDQFTPARTYTERGIRWVNDRLYLHGLFVREDGTIESPVEPEIDAAIDRILRTYPQKFRRHADRVAKAWQSWEQVSACCRGNDGEHHYLRHIEANEPAVPLVANSIVTELRDVDYYGERLVSELAKRLRTSFKPLLGAAVKRACPEFPYPQLTKRKD